MIFFIEETFKHRIQVYELHRLDETHLDAVRGFI